MRIVEVIVRREDISGWRAFRSSGAWESACDVAMLELERDPAFEEPWDEYGIGGPASDLFRLESVRTTIDPRYRIARLRYESEWQLARAFSGIG